MVEKKPGRLNDISFKKASWTLNFEMLVVVKILEV